MSVKQKNNTFALESANFNGSPLNFKDKLGAHR